jgi:hypothetical protein
MCSFVRYQILAFLVKWNKANKFSNKFFNKSLRKVTKGVITKVRNIWVGKKPSKHFPDIVYPHLIFYQDWSTIDTQKCGKCIGNIFNQYLKQITPVNGHIKLNAPVLLSSVLHGLKTSKHLLGSSVFSFFIFLGQHRQNKTKQHFVHAGISKSGAHTVLGQGNWVLLGTRVRATE